MRQLKMGDILGLAKNLKASGLSQKEINELPIYLGDDDELNGIHCGWYVQLIDSESDDEDDKYTVELINENSNNFELNGSAILIS